MTSEWKECTLEQISTILGDGLHGTPKYSINGKYAFINGNNLSNGKIIIKLDTKRVDKCEYEKYKKDLNNRTLLVSINGTLGNIAEYNEEKIILGKSACYFNVKEDIDKYFIKYILLSKTFQDYLNNQATGTTIKNISLKQMREYNFLLPPLETQQKIAKVLSAIDDKIELNNSINNNLEQQAQAIFKSWFVDFEPFGGTMPKFAELVPIEKICKIVTKGTTPTTLGFSFVEQGINFIKAESILDNHSFDYNKFAYIDEVTYKKLSRSILEPKDIVFTIAGTLGRFAIIDEEVIPANTNQAVAIIRADIGKIEPEYLYTFFLGNWHNNYYSKRIQQAVQANLNLTTIKSLPIILLSQEYRIKYLNIIKPILWQIKYNEKENRILTQLRDTLLPKLMSGEIDVSKVEIDDILENQSTDKLLFSEDK